MPATLRPRRSNGLLLDRFSSQKKPSRRLFARLVEDPAEAVPYDELFPGLHGDGEDAHLVRGRPADAEGRGGSLDPGEDAAGILFGLYLNPRFARLQLLVALSHREAKLLFVP